MAMHAAEYAGRRSRDLLGRRMILPQEMDDAGHGCHECTPVWKSLVQAGIGVPSFFLNSCFKVQLIKIVCPFLETRVRSVWAAPRHHQGVARPMSQSLGATFPPPKWTPLQCQGFLRGSPVCLILESGLPMKGSLSMDCWRWAHAGFCLILLFWRLKACCRIA